MSPTSVESSAKADSFFWPFCACLPMMWMQLITGSIEGHSAVLLPQLEESAKFHISLEEESWIASLGIMSTPLFAVAFGPITDRYGRKIICYLFYVMATMGFAFLAFAQSVEHIYVGRLLGASAHGFTLVSVMYMWEVCAEKQRQKMTAFLCPVCSMGILYVYVIGGYLPWNIASMILAFSGLLGLIGLYFIPESPAWQVTQNDIDGAIKGLEWLQRNEDNILKEVEELKKACCNNSNNRAQSFSFKYFSMPTVWKPFLILAMFGALQNGCGFYMLLYYTVDYFQNLGTEMDPLKLTVGLASMRLLSGIFGAYLIARASRKWLTATSSFGMFVVASAALGFILFDANTPVSERPNQWFLVVCSLLYVLLCTLALQPLPWLMTSELYPLPLRGVMSGITFFVLFSLVFFGIKLYPFIVFYTGTVGLLCVFAATTLLTVPFAIFVLPETINKTPQEIEEYFEKRKDGSDRYDTTVYI